MDEDQYMEDTKDHDFQRQMMEIDAMKEERQRRIENLRREFEFINKLDASDMNFINKRKKESAAI